MQSSTEESLNLFVSSIYHNFLTDRGYAFSQEPGQAPQITDNLIKRLKHGFSLKKSFVPKVISSTDHYNPNVDSINHIMSNEDRNNLMRGSFNPDYNIEHQRITDNYFTQEDKKEGFPDVLVQDTHMIVEEKM